jgi:hypothetical protein
MDPKPTLRDFNLRLDATRHPRIALIHATALAMGPIAHAFTKHAPKADIFHLLDDSLSKDHAKSGALTPQMIERFERLANYAWFTQADGILFTCSAFGAAIDACAKATHKPVLKPNQAMFDQALKTSARGAVLHVGLVATFEPSIASMTEEFLSMAQSQGVDTHIHSYFVKQAMQDLTNGDEDLHHQKVSLAMPELQNCDVIMLAQFSMAAAKEACQTVTPIPVLTSPDCAALDMMTRLSQP